MSDVNTTIRMGVYASTERDRSVATYEWDGNCTATQMRQEVSNLLDLMAWAIIEAMVGPAARLRIEIGWEDKRFFTESYHEPAIGVGAEFRHQARAVRDWYRDIVTEVLIGGARR